MNSRKDVHNMLTNCFRHRILQTLIILDSQRISYIKSIQWFNFFSKRFFTCPLDIGKAYFMRFSKMDFFKVSSGCLCTKRRFRISYEKKIGFGLFGQLSLSLSTKCVNSQFPSLLYRQSHKTPLHDL